MAMLKNAENMLKSLARRGDSFARVLLNQGKASDNNLVSSLSKRGDLVAQCQELGPAASIRAKAVVGNLSKMGDMIAVGVIEGTGDVSLACDQDSPFAWCSANAVFTATATVPAGATMQYRFLIDGVERQAWGTGNSLTVTAAGGQANLAPGSHVVTVETSTDSSPVTPEGHAHLTLVVVPDVADAVVLDAAPASPQTAGAPIHFTAAGTFTKGAGSAPFTASIGKYRFSVGATVVQDWSAVDFYVLPETTAAGTYNVKVDVTTAAVPGAAQATDTVAYVLE